MKYKIVVSQGSEHWFKNAIYGDREEAENMCDAIIEDDGLKAEIIEFCDCLAAGCNYCLML